MESTKIDYSKIYSYSKLDLFDKCKKKYYFTYLDPDISPRKKEFRKPWDFNTKGHAVHGAITLFYYLPPNERTFKNLKNCLLEAWFSEIDQYKKPPLGKLGGFNSLEHEKRVYKESLELLKNFYKLGELEPKFHFLPTKQIRNSISDFNQLIQLLDNKHYISGKFDRIDGLKDGSLKIIDYKTSKENQNQFQLDIYKLLAELNFNKKVKQVSFYYLDTGNISNIDTSKIHKDAIKNKILEKIEKIKRTKEFSTSESGLCKYCDFAEICR